MFSILLSAISSIGIESSDGRVTGFSDGASLKLSTRTSLSFKIHNSIIQKKVQIDEASILIEVKI